MPTERSDSAVAFHATRWSVVARASAADPAVAARALGELCEQYWRPLYAFLRRGGRAHDDALDLVQSFCVDLLEHGRVGGADPRQGTFRAYLLGALRHFVANTDRRDRAAKRGGDRITWSLAGAERDYELVAGSIRSPEEEFDRQWAEALLDRAMVRLRADYAAKGRGDVFTALEPALAGATSTPHADVARRLRTTEGAIKVALHRMRGRLRELIRDEVAQTLVDPRGIDDELRHLMAAVGAPGGKSGASQ